MHRHLIVVLVDLDKSQNNIIPYFNMYLSDLGNDSCMGIIVLQITTSKF